MRTQTIIKSKIKTSNKSAPVFGLRELFLVQSRKQRLFIVDLTPKSIQAMVDKKIIDDLLRFRTRCTNTIAKS